MMRVPEQTVHRTLCNSLRGLSGRRITHMQRINSWRATPVSSAVLAQRQSCHTCGTAAFSHTRRPSWTAPLRPEVNSIRPLPDSQPEQSCAGDALCRHATAAATSLLAQSVCVLNFRLGQCCHGASPARKQAQPLERAHRALLVCCTFLRVGSLGLILFCLPFFRQRHHIGMRR